MNKVFVPIRVATPPSTGNSIKLSIGVINVGNMMTSSEAKCADDQRPLHTGCKMNKQEKKAKCSDQNSSRRPRHNW